MYNFFNRLGHIEIISGKRIIFTTNMSMNVTDHFKNTDRMRVFNDLDFKFSCKKISDMTTVDSEAKVSILGLSRETIQYLATYRPKGIERLAQKRIRVYASYEDFGDNLIFDGDIVIAQPSVPPNNWLDITAYVGNYRKQQLYSGSINGKITVEQLIENVAKEFGLTPKYCDPFNDDDVKAERKRLIKGFDCSGTRDDLMKMLNRVSNFILCEDEGLLRIKMKDLTKVRSQGKSVALISESTGMIGVPKILIGTADDPNTGILGFFQKKKQVVSVVVKTLINPSVKLWDRVRLESVYLPDMNGEYTVMQIEYEGHLRGQEWYQTLQLTSSIGG